MKKVRRFAAALVGVALALTLVGPIQAQRLATAICDLNVDGIYEQARTIGWTREEVEFAVELQQIYGEPCTSTSLRGAYVADTENGLELSYIVYIGSDLYLIAYDVFGNLVDLQ